MTHDTTANNAADDTVMRDALRWQADIADSNADWVGYTAWLEADPAHREAIDAIEAIDTAIASHREALHDINVDYADAQHVAKFTAPPQIAPRRRLFYWSAIAATIAFALSLPFATTLFSADQSTDYRTDSSHPMIVKLADGSQIVLAPGSAMTVDAKRQSIALISGAAYFDVRHDPTRTLNINAGEWRVSDIGTRFTVNYGPAGFDVAVAEGSVSVGRRGDSATLPAGRHLFAPAVRGRVIVAPIAIEDVAAWRSGRLTYNDAPIAMVAGDISRYLGKPVIIDSALSGRRFSGTLIGENGEQLIDRLQAIMAIDRRNEDNRVVLVVRRGS